MVARYTALVAATEIWPTPPAMEFRVPPKKLATPPPKMVSVRPVTFWLARRVMVRKLYSRPPRAEAANAASREITRHTKPEGSGLLNS
jgi:hypothetical protein